MYVCSIDHAQVLWALAALDCTTSKEWMDAFVLAYAMKVHVLQPGSRELSDSVWALTRLGYCHPLQQPQQQQGGGTVDSGVVAILAAAAATGAASLSVASTVESSHSGAAGGGLSATQQQKWQQQQQQRQQIINASADDEDRKALSGVAFWAAASLGYALDDLLDDGSVTLVQQQ